MPSLALFNLHTALPLGSVPLYVASHPLVFKCFKSEFTLRNKLLNRLENWIQFSAAVLNWFQYFLNNKGYFVSVDNHTSVQTKITDGIPQDTVLGPLGQIMQRNKTCYHRYGDCKKIYITILPGDYNPLQALSKHLN